MMMRRPVWIAACVALACTASLAWTQKPGGRDGEEVGFLPATQLRGPDFSRFGDLYNGRESVRPDDKELLQKAAEWYANRLTWPQYRNGTPESGKSRMDELVRDCVRLVPPYNPKNPIDPTRRQFVVVFSKFLHAELKKVLKTEWPITRLNAAIILDHLARTGDEEVADTLIQILDDPKENDATRLYALRGLRDLFNLQLLEKPLPFKDKKREARAIEALIKFVNRSPDLGQNPPDAEVEGYRWVRREALIALGQTRYPWVEDENRKPLGSPTAWELLRVCGQNKLNPKPSLKEQIEAIISVCQIKGKLTPDYHVDYAAYYVGWFVRDFARRYLSDPREMAWKYQAVRLLQALQTLKDEAASNRQDRPAADYVNKICAKFEPILRTIESQGTLETTDLKAWLEAKANMPAATSLFKNDPKYQLQPSADE
jgi:hypothetical protein